MARSAIVDPLERFRFIINWSDASDPNGEPTALSRAGFHDMQMPKRATTKINYREGIDADINSVSAGLSNMEDVVLSRGLIIQDQNNEFYKWMSAVHNPSTGLPGRTQVGTSRPANSGSNKYRKDVTVEMLDREGNIARQWRLYNAFPSNFVAGSDLNAGEDGEKSLEALTLSYEDFQEEIPGTSNAVAPTSELA